MGLLGTGRSREPGSGEVSDSGQARVRSRGGRASGVLWRLGTRRRLGRGFWPVSPSLCQGGWQLRGVLGRAKVGRCSPHLLLPSRPASRSRQSLGGGSKHGGRSCTSSSPGLSPSQTRRRDVQRVGRFSAGPTSRCPAPTWKPVFPKSVLGAGAWRRLRSPDRASTMELAGLGGLCGSGGEPGTGAGG